MKKFSIISIDSVDGYERTATIEEIGLNNSLTVHFFEFGEYLDSGESSVCKKAGDIIYGNISVGLVSSSQLTDEKISHYYPRILGSSWIVAVVEVTRIVDDFSLYAISSILNEEILVEFENKVNYQPGNRIRVEGSLELEES